MSMDSMVIRQDRGRDLPRFGPSAEVKTYSCLSDLIDGGDYNDGWRLSARMMIAMEAMVGCVIGLLGD